MMQLLLFNQIRNTKESMGILINLKKKKGLRLTADGFLAGLSQALKKTLA